MTQRIYRLLFVLFVIAGSITVYAQTPSSELGVWIVSPQLDETTILDEPDDPVTIDFDESIGYGLSFNRFWTDAFSTEVAVQKYGADVTVETPTFPASVAGELDVTSLTAMGQLHFNRAGRFSVYVGGGAAWISGDFESSFPPDPGEEDVDLESELTWTGSVGASLILTERISIGGEVKYIPWEAVEEGGDDEDALDVNPLTFSAGLKFRF